MNRIFLRLLVGSLLAALGIVIYRSYLRPENHSNDDYEWIKVAEGFDRPVFLTHAGDERLFVVEQRGKIWIVAEGKRLPNPFLDIETLVNDTANEAGLLSLAFDPAYAQNGFFYLYYNAGEKYTSRIVRYQVSADNPNRADHASETEVLQVAQPYDNHNGGLIAFGKDGYLYLGLGDGGAHYDPHNNGQNLYTFLGKILRLDVSQLPYAIPPDNPFINLPDAFPEIWAYGLRNPWRFSFDRQTGDLYIGDVGQNAIEEIHFQPAASPGGENYGWRIYEGDTVLHPDDSAKDKTFTAPIHTYRHNQLTPLLNNELSDEPHCAITGGYVYRGASLPALQGSYLYGDYCSGNLWRLWRNGETWKNEPFMNTDFTISSFGEDLHGELYLTSLSDGSLWKLISKTP